MPVLNRDIRPRRARDTTDTRPDGALRVVFILGVLEIGGTELQLCRLAADLRAAGNTVTVIVLGNPLPLSRFLAMHDVPVITLGFGFRDEHRPLSPRMMAQQSPRLVSLVKVLRSLQPDICYSALFWANVFAMPAAAMARVPGRVSGRRGLTSSLDIPGPFRPVYSWSQRFAHAVVANSEAVAEDVARVEKFPATRIRVIHNGVDLSDAEANVSSQPPVGIMVANLLSYKGHDDVLQALALLEDPPRVRMIGEGGERPRLEELIDNLHLAQICSLEGELPGAVKLFAEAQFALLASHTEGLPNVVLEAMAAGLPVVATRVGGVPELIDDGVTGLLVPPHDPPSLAKALALIAGDPDLRARMGAEARRRAAGFSYQTGRDEHLRLFRELLHRD